MPRLARWLVPLAALIAAASTRAGAEAAPQTLPDLSVTAEVRTDRAAQAQTVYALAVRDERRRARARAERDETDQVLDSARAQIGDGYAYGGSGPDAFDCSGLTAYVFASTDVALPHNSHGQAALGRPVARDDIRPGDLVFFSTAGAGASHVGVATSATTVISATNSGVMEHSTQDAYWGGHYVTARRVL
jgi:cell wall-associated NlpC family hydrolase